MKKTKSTYGVYNLVEWQALLKMGQATVKVPFTGGSITSHGVTPATFTTDDPIAQFAIEHSPEFSSGKIKLIRRTTLSGDVPIERNPPKHTRDREEHNIATKVSETYVQPVGATPTAATDAPTPEEPTVEGANDVSPSEDPTVEGAADVTTAEEPVSEEQDTASPKETARIEVEFSVNDDARDYLEEQFGAKRSALRTRADILACAEANNVDIKFV